MKLKTVSSTLIAIVTVMFVNINEAKCDKIKNLYQFSFNQQPIYVFFPIPNDILLFNPALGDLNSVSVDISGKVFLTGQTIPFFPEFPPNPAPRPYPVLSRIDAQALTGLFNLEIKSNDFYGMANGRGGISVAPFSFNYFFIIDLLSESLGGATVISPDGSMITTGLSVTETLNNFIGPPGQEIVFMRNRYYNLSILGQQPLLLATTRVDMRIEYDYTPFDDTGGGGVDPIPEPATMLLLGTGLVGVAGAARRRKKNQA